MEFTNKYTSYDKRHSVISTAVYKDTSRDTLYNITQNINNIKRDMLPDDWYFRIYYDSDLLKKSGGSEGSEGRMWKDFVRTQSDNSRGSPKVQLVEFTSSDIDKEIASNLARIYPLFSSDDNVDLVAVINPSMILSEYYVKELREFLESDNDIRVLSDELLLGKIISKKILDVKGWEVIHKNMSQNSKFSIEDILKVIFKKEDLKISYDPKPLLFKSFKLPSYLC